MIAMLLLFKIFLAQILFIVQNTLFREWQNGPNSQKHKQYQTHTCEHDDDKNTNGQFLKESGVPLEKQKEGYAARGRRKNTQEKQ